MVYFGVSLSRRTGSSPRGPGIEGPGSAAASSDADRRRTEREGLEHPVDGVAREPLQRGDLLESSCVRALNAGSGLGMIHGGVRWKSFSEPTCDTMQARPGSRSRRCRRPRRACPRAGRSDPSGGVEHLALERLEAGDVRERRPAQTAQPATSARARSVLPSLVCTPRGPSDRRTSRASRRSRSGCASGCRTCRRNARGSRDLLLRANMRDQRGLGSKENE